MKNVALFLFLGILFSSYTTSPFQQKTGEQSQDVQFIDINPDHVKEMTLYVINNNYYLTDSDVSLVKSMDKSKIKRIQLVQEKKGIESYVVKLKKYAEKIKTVLVIETSEEFRPESKGSNK